MLFDAGAGGGKMDSYVNDLADERRALEVEVDAKARRRTRFTLA